MRIVAGVRRVFDRLTHWFGRHVVPVLTPVIRERRNWLYLAYGAAVIHWLGGTELATALLLPAIALGVVLLARADLAHKVVAAGLWAAALVRIAVAGSLSPHALHDPLFWGIAAVAALGISAVTGRWRVAPGLSAAVAGACTMMATLLPRFPDFEVTLPALDLTTLGESIAALSDRFGPVGALLLMAVSLQAIVPGGAREARAVRLVAAARGALVAGLVLSLAGAVPGELIDARMWVVALGLLLGLVEAKARSSRAARAPRQLPSADSV
ncbi:MAG: hypothetical protein HYY76_13530 [Acidobacteria bacterium]|nr:hypothetical protein [Acidobacteriota bacterium]